MHGRSISLLLLAAALTGCDPTAMPQPPVEPAALGASYNSDECGTIAGVVNWSGTTPQVPPYLAPLNPLAGGEKVTRPNPNLPIVDPQANCVVDAVVYLQAVDVRKSRPWDHAPVDVLLQDNELLVQQGDYRGRRGFVQRGGAVRIVAQEAAFEALQGRGASYFNLPLPDAHQPRTRRLEQAGVVELSSGVGRFWMRGHLFVAEHPYYARTDAAGRFTLPQVPAGNYRLVCWHPNWHEAAREHDADTCCLCRVVYQPAVELVQEIEVRAGSTTAATFSLSVQDFYQ